jgi:hypothetical protein
MSPFIAIPRLLRPMASVGRKGKHQLILTIAPDRATVAL